MDRIYFVYGLLDPRSLNVCYIGKTGNLRGRMYVHVGRRKGVNPDVTAWLGELRSLGLRPRVVVLYQSKNGADAYLMEQTLIVEYRRYQIGLLNRAKVTQSYLDGIAYRI